MPPHAPCRLQQMWERVYTDTVEPLPPHAPCRLQPKVVGGHAECFGLCLHTPRADCNTRDGAVRVSKYLCLHTPRADCNCQGIRRKQGARTFASTRPVQIATRQRGNDVACPHFASTRPVQIATSPVMLFSESSPLCLHTPRADCNGRNAQNCNMHFSERVLSR